MGVQALNSTFDTKLQEVSQEHDNLVNEIKSMEEEIAKKRQRCSYLEGAYYELRDIYEKLLNNGVLLPDPEPEQLEAAPSETAEPATESVVSDSTERVSEETITEEHKKADQE